MSLTRSEVIALRREWRLGDLLDAGGFGRVFEATSEGGDVVALKLIPKAPGASRELLFEDLAGARNVVPIIDSGEWGDNWVIVMPKAVGSLRKYIAASAGLLPVEEVVAILGDVNAALVDLDGKVVNRDLKPENILRLNGRWSLGDFGIARYAEASTATDTKKFAMTAAYAAPERWRAERATTATDVYSLGVVGYELLAGRRPFLGPTIEDFREQHLTATPPPLAGADPALAALVAECLIKPASARPRPANIAARLSRALKPTNPGAARLREANAQVAVRASEASAAASAASAAAQRRRELQLAAVATFGRISETLRAELIAAAPSAVLIGTLGDAQWEARLGAARLILARVAGADRSAWGARAPAFDVLAHANVMLDIPRDAYGYEGRSHALWYCDAVRLEEYRWFETAFIHSPLMGRSRPAEPFSLNPGPEAMQAVGSGMGTYDVAWPFTPIDQGDEQEFIDRWLALFAEAAAGRLQHPRVIPERAVTGSWRKT